ncbi:2-oxoglutarate dehydrogenase complex dihydrolipoyllysine-residue succinyltransferase [bacterium]|nr:2-oxoglutarate dehydrogenase complex dihydrolipoyllysine-residue succinyltransferase [bacterium]
MIHEVEVPSVGESISEGILAVWLVGDGERIEKGQPLFELETDKASTEVPAPESGVVAHKAAADDEVKVGQVVATIDTEATGEARAKKEEKKPAPKEAPKKEEPKAEPKAPAPQKVEQPVEKKAEAPAKEGASHRQASSVARKMAEQYGVDVAEIPGTGPGGRVTREDVLLAMERTGRIGEEKAEESAPEPAAPQVEEEDVPRLPPMPPVAKSPHELETPKPTPSEKPAPKKAEGDGDVTRERMSMLRRRIAERLVSAQHNAAMLTTFNDVDMSAVMNLRREYKEQFKDRHGVGLGFMSFFVRATVKALQDFPRVNAEIDETDIVLHNRYHVGVAVSTPRGLVVPVLRDANERSFADIESQIVDFATRARAGKIELDELQGGTFSITNGGVFGSLLSTPILNPPQSAILGMHRIEERPVARNGEVVIRPMMYLALSYDHRIVDGREAVSFLVRIKECIENPERLLLDV